MKATTTTPCRLLKRSFSSHHRDPSEIETLLRKSSSNARRQETSSFARSKHKHQQELLDSNHFFTSHVLPQKASVKGPVTREYAFLLPNGVCIYQPQPTTKVTKFVPTKEWEKLVREYEHLGWQVLGHSGPFLVLQRLKNSRQDSFKLVRQSAFKYGIGWIVLTTGIFIGGWVYGV